MGSSITFLHHKPVYEDAWKSSKGFSIDWSMTFAALLTFWSNTT
jgi:hypothetical protein